MTFIKAKPVWIAGREKEKNLFVGFRAVFTAGQDEPMLLRLTGASSYRVWLNGNFLVNGPARAGHGYFRLDEIPLQPTLSHGENILAIEIAGYNANSYSTLNQPSFLQAEVISNGNVVVSTGSTDFKAFVIPGKIQKIQRYSFQRTFAEAYCLEPGYDRWRTDASFIINGPPLATQPSNTIIPRNVPFPSFELRQPVRLSAQGLIFAPWV